MSFYHRCIAAITNLLRLFAGVKNSKQSGRSIVLGFFVLARVLVSGAGKNSDVSPVSRGGQSIRLPVQAGSDMRPIIIGKLITAIVTESDVII